MVFFSRFNCKTCMHLAVLEQIVVVLHKLLQTTYQASRYHSSTWSVIYVSIWESTAGWDILTNGSMAPTISPTMLTPFSLVISSSEMFLRRTKFRSFNKAISLWSASYPYFYQQGHPQRRPFKSYLRLRFQRIVGAHLAEGCHNLLLVILDIRKEGLSKIVVH